jgi:hypothetical protein
VSPRRAAKRRSRLAAICYASLLLGGAAHAAEQCQPISAERVDQWWSYYTGLPGAAPSGGNDKYECVGIDSTKQVVCRTTPSNPAHPSIVIRTIVQDSNGISIKLEGDTAGDCAEFLKMMDEYKALNDKVREGFRRQPQ